MPPVQNARFLKTLKDTFHVAVGFLCLCLLRVCSIPKAWNRLSPSARASCALTILISILVICVLYSKGSVHERSRSFFKEQLLSQWLAENGFENITNIFETTGKDRYELTDLDENDFNSVDGIRDNIMDKLRNAVISAKDKKLLNLWLFTEYNIQIPVIEKLNKIGIKSLIVLSKITEEMVENIVEEDITMYARILKAKEVASTITGDQKMMEYYVLTINKDIPFFRILFIILTLVVGGTIVWFIMVVDCFSRAINSIPDNFRQHQIRPNLQTLPHGPQTNNNKGWLWNWFVGSYVSAQNCNVSWGWTEPQDVGNTMSFSVQLYQKNGKPFKITDTRPVHVEILHSGEKVSCTKQFDKVNPNTVSVFFTVHKSGVYKLNIMVNGRHIKDSPFIKVFEAGSVDASKTGFTNYCSTIVCTVGQSYPLVIETRDCYDNPALFKADHQNYFKIKVTETESNTRYIPTTQIIHNADSKQLTMHIKMAREGCFQAVVTYGDIKLKNGDFSILVISDEDLEVVNKTTSKKSHNIWYEARLISENIIDSTEKAKKVYVYISPKQLTIKEYFLKIIGKKLHTWRVCPSTKFSFIGYNNKYDAPVMKIYGCSQLPVMIATKDRNIIAATFTNFLLRNIGGSETFQDKQLFFFHEVKKSTKRGNVTLKIDRANLLYSSYKAAKSLYASDWFKTFNVEFVNELGLDWGGLRKEWIEVLCTELFDPDKSGLFTRFTDNSQGLIHPCDSPGVKLKYYELAGKIVGKSLLDSSLGSSSRLLIKANFTRSFLAQIIGLQVNYKYFETDDPELYKTKIKFIEENNIADMELTFSEEEYLDGQLLRVVHLVPNGSKIAVTDENKIQYLNCLAQYKLVTCVREQVESFLKGLNSLIPDNVLSIFDENELELLMCGTDNYSFTDFKCHADVSGNFIGTKLLEWFWAIVASFTDEQMARLLQFTTGSSQLPPGGFKHLDPKFTITFTSYSVDSLPTAHTW